MIKVRFAPSPTGFLHIGGARTALFNWLYARAQKGVFVLRIEDTDQVRSKKEYEEEILESMKWLNLDWDELCYQTDRFDIYREYAQKLIDQGKAYKDGEAVLLKMTTEEIKLYDIIRGEITFDTANYILRDEVNKPVLDNNGQTRLKDEVLIKSDGSPAYSFCCAIDDALMEISHVIRGEDHISNTPKQILIYKALGFKIPKYAHLPLIMGEDGSRLSKRFGAVAVSDYKKQGYLPDALINYLMLLGWSPGNNQEIISLSNAVKKFSLKKVNNSAAIFSYDKLNWVNAEYLKQQRVDDVVALVRPRLAEKNFGNINDETIERAVGLYKGRLNTLNDFIDWADFFFTDNFSTDDEAKHKHVTDENIKILMQINEALQDVDDFSAENVEKAFKEKITALQLKPVDLIHPLRVVLTGKGIGPSLFQIISILGKDKTIQRLTQAAA